MRIATFFASGAGAARLLPAIVHTGTAASAALLPMLSQGK